MSGNRTESVSRIKTKSLNQLRATGRCMAYELEKLGVRPDLVATWKACADDLNPTNAVVIKPLDWRYDD